MIWLTLLPFTLWDSCHWAMLPIAGIVSFLLLGIEEIGVQVGGVPGSWVLGGLC